MATRSSSKKRKEYEEQPGWGTVFQRADNTPPQPQFTGQGVLDRDTLKQIKAADGNFQIAVWSLDRDGEPLRNRDGTRRFRVHIEPPYDDGEQNGNGRRDDDPHDDGKDIPF